MTYSLITHTKKQAGFSLSPLMLPFYALDHNDLMTSATTSVLCRALGTHIWFESNLVNFLFPKVLKTVLSSPE